MSSAAVIAGLENACSTSDWGDEMGSRRRRSQWMFLAIIAVITWTVGYAPLAEAVPSNFPDIDSYPAVDPAEFYSPGVVYDESAWLFTTAASGLSCHASVVADRGLLCQYDPPNPSGHRLFVTASTSEPGAVSDDGPISRPGPPKPFPPNTRIATPNGISCLLLSDDTMACRASPPPNARPGMTDVRGHPFGEHGFIFTASGRSTVF